MSSSGLIYAVIVGAWAAYLVPMWLRRQDELNEARPTERFSTAIRLLSGRAAMERKISRHLDETQPLALPTPLPDSPRGSGPVGRTDGLDDPATARDSDASAAVAHATSQAHTASHAHAASHAHTTSQAHAAASAQAPVHALTPAAHRTGSSSAVASRRRAALLARRRRMVVILFAAFTAGMVVAAVGGIALLWIPAVPAVLFSLYIAQMRSQERRRYEVKLDRRRATEAAQRVRQQAAARREAAAAAAGQQAGHAAGREAGRENATARAATEPPRAAGDNRHGAGATTSGTGALGGVTTVAGTSGTSGTSSTSGTSGTGHAAPWADDDRPEHAGPAAPSTARGGEGWDPVPVPLPTYVTAPVAPRATLGLDLSAPDTYSSGRARRTPPPQQGQQPAAPASRRPAPKPTTPVFDQYADDAPRAANE